MDPDLAITAASVAVEEGGPGLFDLALRRVRDSAGAAWRTGIIAALARVEPPALAWRALALAHDPALRPTERSAALWLRAERAAGGESVLAAFERDPEGMLAVLPAWLVGDAPAVFERRCDPGELERVRALFQARLDRYPEMKRSLAQTLEAIRLCATRRAADGEVAARWLEARAAPARGAASP